MKDILVIQTGGLYDNHRLQTAISFSRAFDSYVTAAVVSELPDPMFYAADPAMGVAPIEGELRDEIEASARDLLRRVDANLGEANVAARSLKITNIRSRLGSDVCQLALLSDLLIGSIPASSTNRN